MTRLKLTDLADEKPVRLTLELPARLHRDLTAYALAVNGGDPKGALTCSPDCYHSEVESRSFMMVV